MRRPFLTGCSVLLFAGAVSAQPQVVFEDGTTATIRPQRLAPGPAQGELGAAAVGLPFFTTGVPSFNRVLPITLIGGDPSHAGAGATTIPTVIVPLLLNFLDGSGSL